MAPEWLDDLPVKLIQDTAASHGLDWHVVAAMIMIESAGKPWKARFEPHTEKYTVRVRDSARRLGITVDTEKMFQMCSWGMLQIMGFKAREMGYADDIPKLCHPDLGIEWGCRALKGFLDRYDGIYRHAIAAYNAGSVRTDKRNGLLVNQNYVDKVLQHASQLTGVSPK